MPHEGHKTRTSEPTHCRTTRTNISVAAPLYDQAKTVIASKGFRSFSGYVEFLLRIDLERQSLGRA